MKKLVISIYSLFPISVFAATFVASFEAVPETFDSSTNLMGILPLSGSFVYEITSSDTNSQFGIGEYELNISSFSLDSSQGTIDQILGSGEMIVQDNYGCDCVFIDIDVSGEFASQSFDTIQIFFQSEFAGLGFDFLSSEDPIVGPFELPDGVVESREIEFFSGADNLVPQPVQLRFTSFTISAIPEPSSTFLLILSSAGIFTRRRRTRRAS